MDLTELLGDAKLDQSLQACRGSLSERLSAVEALVIDLDKDGCQALLEEVDSQTSPGEAHAEMKALRVLRVVGSPKRWHAIEDLSVRLFNLLRPVVLQELELVGVEAMKVVRTLLACPSLHPTLVSLKVGLHGFHFLAQEDLVTLGAPLRKLRCLHLFGISAAGSRLRDSRMFVCADAFLGFLGQIRNPEEFEVLHLANAGILGDDQQIASVLRSLGCFGRLRRLKLPLPSLPLSVRELLTLRLTLTRLLFFAADPECIEGSDAWPDGDEWPPMTQVWPMRETITPLSVFSYEFVELFPRPGQAAVEWARLPEAEQRFWNQAVPKIQEAYHSWEQASSGLGSLSQESASDTRSASNVRGDAAHLWRAAPEVRAPSGQGTGAGDGEAFDATRASTHGVGDWRAEERAALRGVLELRASDVCKEKARLRRDAKQPRGSEGLEFGGAAASCGRATQDCSRTQAAEELKCSDGAQQCCARDSAGAELDGPTTTVHL